MHAGFRISLVGTCCAAVAASAVAWITLPKQAPDVRRLHPSTTLRRQSFGASVPQHPYPAPELDVLSDPNAAPGSNAKVFIDPFAFDGSVFSETALLAEETGEPGSLREYREVISRRVGRAKARLEERYARLRPDSAPTVREAHQAIALYRDFAFVALYEGNHDEAASWLLKSLELARRPAMPAEIRAHMMALLGINALRRGEEDNCIGCVGPSSCIYPIDRSALHAQQAGSREAVRWFTAYLDEWPGDLRVRWLLNIAAMTLGEYPERVPPRFLVPIGPFRSKIDVGRFDNIALRAGLNSRGPDLAGGCIFDDFTGDGRPDVFTTSFDVRQGATLYVNRGDGTFEDRSISAGLSDQVYALNAVRADYDNDGWPDVLLLRGAWVRPARMSLLRNKGNGVFVDVTMESGLGESIATESAAWGDYDNDGRLDLFVCGEYLPPQDLSGATLTGEPDPRNRCRLYHNAGSGKFVDVAREAGVLNERWAKGSAWGDYDNDGRIDLFVSNMDGPPRLYRNLGNGHFEDVAPSLGIFGPPHGFPCMFLDYDNDGWLDILVADYGSSLAELVADQLQILKHSDNHAHLYHNLGPAGFREVSQEVGLAHPLSTMSVNAGDIDNDGFLDLYFGTGWMSLSGLAPDVMYLSAGKKFVDVTESTGTGHLQKGHGISFADWDSDGDLDLFVVLGGGFPGDRGYNALFQNPGHKRHWLKVKLIGTRTNRSAIGAKIRVELKGPQGAARAIHRVIGNNGSFGGNSLVESIGLGGATAVDTLTVHWPASGTTQTFQGLAADQTIEVTEGSSSLEVQTQPRIGLNR
jgi:FG-GAP-like repeat/ASPIC and UnbV